MQLFVTGGTGFLGSHFINRATQAGHIVRALRREGSVPRVNLLKEPEWIDRDLETVQADDFNECEVLVHFAAVGVSPQKATLTEMLRWNVQAAIRLWEKAYDGGVRSFMICGSALEYGKTAEKYEFIPTDAPLEPISDYAASKAAASMFAAGFANQRSIKMVIFRPFTLFGPGQNTANFWPSLRDAALSGRDFEMSPGQQIYDFLPVEEAAKQIVALLREDLAGAKYAVRHIGSGAPRTLASFAEEWWLHWGATKVLRIGARPYREDQLMRLMPKI